MKKTFLLGMLLLFISSSLYAQRITGKVTGKEDGMPIGFATVVVKGQTTATTTADDGTYSITLPEGATTLVFSFFGMKDQEVLVGGRSIIDVELESDAIMLEETVVTALGISREKKALGYSVQEVKAEDLIGAGTTSVAQSLSGKVAGMNIKKTATPGGSSQIVIRGQNSLTGNNSPLIVVDGVPFDNTNNVGSLDGAFYTNSFDSGDGLSQINDADIESISVLKGPSATALYGSRAGNGVVLITTKKGTAKGLNINVNTGLTIDRLMIQPDFQNTYGYGTGGVTLDGANETNVRQSWGSKMDGRMLTDWTGKTRPFSAYDNDMYDLFQTGTTWTTGVDVTMGGEKATLRAAVSRLEQKGVVPTNSLERNTFTLRGTGTILSGLTFDAKATYTHMHGRNRPETGFSIYNPMFGIIYNPRNIHWSDYADLMDKDGNIIQYEKPSGVMTNLLWGFYQKGNDDFTDRLNGMVSIKYDFTDWLYLQARYGIDTYSRDHSTWNNEIKWPGGHNIVLSNGGKGRYTVGNNSFTEANADFLLVAQKDNLFDSKFSGSVSFGGNIMDRQTRNLNSIANGLVIPGIYRLSNSIDPVTSTNSYTNKQIQSLYGFGQLSYDGWLYLDLTARNDWSSTLPKDTRSFFYPSVSLGWVVTDMLHKNGVSVPSWITFAKIRGSWAQAGNDTNPYAYIDVYSQVPSVIEGVNGAAIGTNMPPKRLRSELITSYELGAELRLFNSRLGFDFTYYSKRATNQIMNLVRSATVGALTETINAGRIDNHGVELLVNGTPVKTKDLRWDVMLGYSRNNSKVKELFDDLSEFALGIPGNAGNFVEIKAKVGEPYGQIYVTGYQRDPNGNVYVGDDGLPLFTADRSVNVGNMNPDWTGSISSNLSYKGFNLSFLIDIRVGGKMFMSSIARMRVQGQLEETLAGREEWYAGTGGYLVEGIVKSTGQPNTTYVNPQTYWLSLNNKGEPHVFNMTNVRMREMSLGYTFPKAWFSKTPINDLKLSVVGNNLFFFYNRMPSYDPECTYTTSNAQGFEAGSLPSTRSIGFNVNITF